MRIELTTSELTEILMTKEKGTWCYLETETNVRMNKTGNPFHNQIKKTSFLNVLLGNDYKGRVVKKTGNVDFEPEKNRVGEHISKCVLFNENTRKHYLQYENFDYKSIPNYPKNLIPPDPIFRYNGDEIDRELFRSFLIKSSPNKYGINFLSVTIENIKECHLDGNHYIVVNPMNEVEVGEVQEVEV